MKTISVKQVAAALDLTPRAIIYRLEKKQLKGIQTPNAFGKNEWRVYPTKEIVDGLKRNSGKIEQARKEAGSENADSNDFDFTPEDVEIVETSDIWDGSSERSSERSSETSSEADGQESFEPRDWRTVAQDTVKSMADELVRPLGEIIKQQQIQLMEQQALLIERDRLIEDKERQLRLLPDLQKQSNRKQEELELKHLENEALRKQLEAVQSKNASLESALAASKNTWWRRMFLPRGN